MTASRRNPIFPSYGKQQQQNKTLQAAIIWILNPSSRFWHTGDISELGEWQSNLVLSMTQSTIYIHDWDIESYISGFHVILSDFSIEIYFNHTL